MSKAYLVAKFVLVRGIPRFRGVNIYSSNANNLTRLNNEIYLDVDCSKECDSYNDAHVELVEYIKKSWHLKWAKEFLENVDVDNWRRELEEEENNPMNVALEHMGELP